MFITSLQWLEWSTTLLTPALVHYMGVGHRANPNALPVLNALVKKLDDHLSKSPFLCGDKLTAADISVWCLLAPEGTLKGAQQIDNLLKWYRKITAMTEVQAVLTFEPLKGLTFNALQNSNRYGGLYHVPLKVPASSAGAGNLLADTGSNLADTLTEEELSTARANFIYNAPTERKEPRTVLPKAGERNLLITSALPYVNNVPHLGNIIGCVLSADIFARYVCNVIRDTLRLSETEFETLK